MKKNGSCSLSDNGSVREVGEFDHRSVMGADDQAHSIGTDQLLSITTYNEFHIYE